MGARGSVTNACILAVTVMAITLVASTQNCEAASRRLLEVGDSLSQGLGGPMKAAGSMTGSGLVHGGKGATGFLSGTGTGSGYVHNGGDHDAIHGAGALTGNGQLHFGDDLLSGVGPKTGSEEPKYKPVPDLKP